MFSRQCGMKKYAVWWDKMNVTSNSARKSLFIVYLEFQEKNQIKVVQMLV